MFPKTKLTIESEVTSKGVLTITTNGIFKKITTPEFEVDRILLLLQEKPMYTSIGCNNIKGKFDNLVLPERMGFIDNFYRVLESPLEKVNFIHRKS